MVAVADSPLGFRHGPKTILNAATLVVVFVGNDPYPRQYDVDLIRELRQTPSPAGSLRSRRRTGCQRTRTICCSNPRAPGAAADLELCLPYAMFAQSLALSCAPSRSAFGRTIRMPRAPSVAWSRAFRSIAGNAEREALPGHRRWRQQDGLPADRRVRARTGRADEGPAYYLEIGWEALRTMLARGIEATLTKPAYCPGEIDFAYLGLPAYGEDSRALAAFDAVASPPLRPPGYQLRQ